MRGSQRVGGSMRSSAVIPIADDEAKQIETGPGPVEQGMKRKKRVIPNDGKVKQKLAVDVAMVNAKCPLVRAAWPVPPSVGQTLTQKLNLQAGPWQFWDAWLSKLRLELYAGSGRLTEAARAAGLVCGPAVDWLYDPSSQSTSASPTQLCLDLGTQKDRDIVRQLIQENTPSWLHSGEPCTFWVTLGRSTARKFPQEWDRLRTKAVEHLHFSIDLAEYQHENGRMASRESPLCAGSWQTTDWCRLFLNGFQKNRYDSCRFGLVDEHGRPLKKPGTVAANRKMSHIARWAAVRVPDAGLSHTGDATASLLKQVLVS
eukprot:s78_g17.t1